MTDKALEAALLPCPFCGGDAVVANVLTFVGVECGECGADIGCNPSSYPQDQRGPETWITEAIAAWNRRAPLSALPGEAEVVALIGELLEWRVDGPQKRSHATQLLCQRAANALQAMRARAEKAERERDYWQKQHDERTFFLGQCATEKETAEARVKEQEEALRGMVAIVDDSAGVAGYHKNGNIAEWDEFEEVEIARTALKGGSNG